MPTSSINVYLPSELAAQVRRVASLENRSASGVIVEAVRLKLSGRQEEDIAFRRLAPLEARIDRAVRDSIVIKEILLWFVRVWLEHNPPIEEGLEESAGASAAARFELFLGYIADSLNAGSSVAPFELTTRRNDNNGAAP